MQSDKNKLLFLCFLQEREEILAIHTKPWTSPPSQELMAFLAEKSVGYCGSDLRLLCSEAVVQALRRRYPQIYKSSQKLLLQADAVNVRYLTYI